MERIESRRGAPAGLPAGGGQAGKGPSLEGSCFCSTRSARAVQWCTRMSDSRQQRPQKLGGSAGPDQPRLHSRRVTMEALRSAQQTKPSRASRLRGADRLALERLARDRGARTARVTDFVAATRRPCPQAKDK